MLRVVIINQKDHEDILNALFVMRSVLLSMPHNLDVDMLKGYLDEIEELLVTED